MMKRSCSERFSRREMLRRAGMGFGLLGLAETLHAAGKFGVGEKALRTHFPAHAKRVIFLFMNGGPSHVDTFDPKPALKKYEGQKPSQKVFLPVKGGYAPSPFRFEPHGQSGVVLSELFPRLSQCVDDLCIVRSMHTDIPNHEPGLLVMHSGVQQPVRPSLGSWISYGLGNENENLPSFVVLAPRHPVVGPQLWSSSFLPGTYQGMAVDTNDMRIELDLLNALNRLHLEARSEDPALEGQIRTMEQAFAMQAQAAEAFDISREPALIREMYGDSNFARSCLLARRLSERGVRFVQVYYLGKNDNQPWDTHQDNDNRHRKLCADSDRATAALLLDLKRRGLLDETLVIWSGEFGRTPYAQPAKDNKPGRDHHHTGFSLLLAGGGIKGGQMFGATDELGMNAVENPVHVHDLHATILYLLGLDHEKLTYRYSGRDFRLTDVQGQVVHHIIG